MKLRLIGEAPENLEDFEIIEEQSNLGKPSTLYVAGPMIGCNQKNRNGRYYDFENTRPEVSRYIEEMVKTGRAMGELNHPASADVNLERACHLVTELTEISDGYHGKAKVLSTPCGMILRSLINDGVRIGEPKNHGRSRCKIRSKKVCKSGAKPKYRIPIQAHRLCRQISNTG